MFLPEEIEIGRDAPGFEVMRPSHRPATYKMYDLNFVTFGESCRAPVRAAHYLLVEFDGDSVSIQPDRVDYVGDDRALTNLGVVAVYDDVQWDLLKVWSSFYGSVS